MCKDFFLLFRLILLFHLLPSTAIHIISFEVFSFRRLNKFSSMSIIFFLTFVLLDKLHTSENQFFFLFTQFFFLGALKIKFRHRQRIMNNLVQKLMIHSTFPFAYITHRGNWKIFNSIYFYDCRCAIDAVFTRRFFSIHSFTIKVTHSNFNMRCIIHWGKCVFTRVYCV
jgi:hypothetical protein